LVGITVPFQTSVLAAVQPARVERIAFPEGALVHEGDLVVQLEDKVQAARTEFAKAAAESSLEIDLARTRWQQAQRDYERLIRLHGEDLTSSKELSDAAAAAEAARLAYEISIFNQAQAARAYQREQRMLEEFRIKAPFDAYVAEHLKHPGESVDQLEGVVRLTQLNPLIATVDCPLSLAGTIREGDSFNVRPADGSVPSRAGKVIFASKVADGASQTFRVKLAVANGDSAWMSGWKVIVDFGRELQQARAKADADRPDTP
jgi:multidrug efflux system membrane fusion protein